MSVDDVADIVSDHLEGIRKLFKAPVRITVLVRRPEVENAAQDFILTDDNLDAAINSLNHLKER